MKATRSRSARLNFFSGTTVVAHLVIAFIASFSGEILTLFVTDRIRSFAGWTEEETKPLLDYLRAHATRYEFQYRHRWQQGDLLLLDNFLVTHGRMPYRGPRKILVAID